MKQYFKFCFYMIMAIGFLIPNFAHAQGGVFGGGAQRIPTIQFERNNQYMADILNLQNQVALLKKMIDRQKELNDMAENLSMLSMPFVPPAPEYEICAQLPANDVCAGFYTDLYPNYNMALVMPSALPIPSLPQIDRMPTTQNIDELDSATVERLSEADFMWAEINCLNEKCRAIVVSNMQGNSSRYTIRVGDKLPNGLVVESISADGVITSRGSKTIKLEPAPSSVTPQNIIS